jgi:general secretion pathway protein G
MEIMIAVAILSVIAFVAIPKYQDYRERARVLQAVADISAMNAQLRSRMQDTRTPPANLSEIGEAGRADPWGNPYVYQALVGPGVAGKARKNKNLVPINSSYDLYSKGKDGASVAPLTSPVSRDDVILANDGGFVGLAKDYE